MNMRKTPRFARQTAARATPDREIDGAAHQKASFASNAPTVTTRRIEQAHTAYCRERHLPRLVPMDFENLTDSDAAAALRIIAMLERALRAERRLGKAGHWTYDLNRHISLVAALKAEIAAHENPDCVETKYVPDMATLEGSAR